MIRRVVAAFVVMSTAACGGGEKSVGPDPLLTATPFDLTAKGLGAVNERFTSELWVHGATAYTGSWGARTTAGVTTRGNAVKIWDVSSDTPVLVDSLIISDITTLGDIQTTADGKYLVVATEPAGSLLIFDLSNPRKPVLVTRFQNADLADGVHTAEVQPVNGRLYAFLSIDPRGSDKARLVILDITDATSPTMVFSQIMGNPFVHDVFVRDGILMTALWNDGLSIWDIGGGGKGGTVSNPVLLGNVKTEGGQVHNVYWDRDPLTHDRRFAFVGQEGPASIPNIASGDVHVIDVSDMAKPREVGFYHVDGAGVHNFSVDENRGILYAAYYNGGVRALSIRGEVGSCTANQKAPDGRCDLNLMERVLAKGPVNAGGPVFFWGVQFVDGALFGSDMINGLWRLSTVP